MYLVKNRMTMFEESELLSTALHVKCSSCKYIAGSNIIIRQTNEEQGNSRFQQKFSLQELLKDLLTQL